MADSSAGEGQRPLRPDGLERPRSDRFTAVDPSFDACMKAHDSAQSRGDIGYMDPSSGLFVMTARYHAERGSCCERGCRHCPYSP